MELNINQSFISQVSDAAVGAFKEVSGQSISKFCQDTILKTPDTKEDKALTALAKNAFSIGTKVAFIATMPVSLPFAAAVHFVNEAINFHQVKQEINNSFREMNHEGLSEKTKNICNSNFKDIPLSELKAARKEITNKINSELKNISTECLKHNLIQEGKDYSYENKKNISTGKDIKTESALEKYASEKSQMILIGKKTNATLTEKLTAIKEAKSAIDYYLKNSELQNKGEHNITNEFLVKETADIIAGNDNNANNEFGFLLADEESNSKIDAEKVREYKENIKRTPNQKFEGDVLLVFNRFLMEKNSPNSEDVATAVRKSANLLAKGNKDLEDSLLKAAYEKAKNQNLGHEFNRHLGSAIEAEREVPTQQKKSASETAFQDFLKDPTAMEDYLITMIDLKDEAQEDLQEALDAKGTKHYSQKIVDDLQDCIEYYNKTIVDLEKKLGKKLES